MKKTSLFLLLVFCTGLSFSQALVQPKWKTLKTIEKDFSGGVIDGYTLYLPKTYAETNKRYPILFFLHGGLGVGGEIKKVNEQPLPEMILEKQAADKEALVMLQDSFIVVNPHMNAGSFDSRQFYLYEDAFREMLTDLHKGYRTDDTRIYVTGLSRGGHGTWGIASRMGEVFAAAVPICGGLHGIQSYAGLDKLPLWVAHNTGDRTVSYENSTEAVNEIEKRGGPRFYIITTEDAAGTKYLAHKRIFSSIDKEGHDAWTELYKRPEVYKWLLRQRRKR